MLWRPVRLAIVFFEGSFVGNFIFIGVQQIDIGIRLDCFSDFVQRFRRQFIVVVQHRQVIAR